MDPSLFGQGPESFTMPRRAIWLVAALLLPSLAPARCAGAEGYLDTIRDDVRGRPGAGSVFSPPPSLGQAVPPKRSSSSRFQYHDDGSLATFCVAAGFWAVTSPLWFPVAATDDDLQFDAHFQRFPYHVTQGSVVRPADLPGATAAYAKLSEGFDDRMQRLRTGLLPPRLRRWSARLSAEYAGELDDLDRVGGRLLVNTASRFGVDTEMSYLEERLPGGQTDRLWLGDGNLIFRFAQSDWSEWRMGVGFNWLDDRQKTDYGFNFTYGVDFFPRRPWVVSLDVDWGKLGRAGLFRGRATAGVVVWGVEPYIGYEYLDIGRTQCNNLVAGVRAWF